MTDVYPVFAALNRGDGHSPLGSVSNPEPVVVSTACERFGVSVSGHDKEHPVMLIAAPAASIPRKFRRNVEGISYIFQYRHKNFKCPFPCQRQTTVLSAADLLIFRAVFDTASDGLGGSMGGENRVLTPKIGVFMHFVVGEGLDGYRVFRATRVDFPDVETVSFVGEEPRRR